MNTNDFIDIDSLIDSVVSEDETKEELAKYADFFEKITGEREVDSLLSFIAYTKDGKGKGANTVIGNAGAMMNSVANGMMDSEQLCALLFSVIVGIAELELEHNEITDLNKLFSKFIHKRFHK